jgi:RNA polymerase sigma-70 factor (ECF subfamily)
MGVTGSSASTTEDERHLVELSRSGDRSAFRQIVESHQGRVYRIALALTRDHHDAEDLVQDVFIQAYRSIGSFRGDAALSTWLHRLTLNAATSAARRRRARPAEPLDTGGDTSLAVADERASGDPLRAAEGSAIRAAVGAALGCLTPAERAVFLLHHDGGLPLAEVARATGRADGTVRNLLFRAVRKLRRELAGFAGAHPEEVPR